MRQRNLRKLISPRDGESISAPRTLVNLVACTRFAAFSTDLDEDTWVQSLGEVSLRLAEQLSREEHV